MHVYFLDRLCVYLVFGFDVQTLAGRNVRLCGLGRYESLGSASRPKRGYECCLEERDVSAGFRIVQ